MNIINQDEIRQQLNNKRKQLLHNKQITNKKRQQKEKTTKQNQTNQRCSILIRDEGRRRHWAVSTWGILLGRDL